MKHFIHTSTLLSCFTIVLVSQRFELIDTSKLIGTPKKSTITTKATATSTKANKVSEKQVYKQRFESKFDY